MLLSVVMPVYDESLDEINTSIKAILHQTITNFEVIIVDDNPASSCLRYCLKAWSYKDSRVKIIFHKKNMKLVKSENDGINQAIGKYIVRMDADDVSSINRIKSQLNFLLNNDLDLVGCNCSLIDIKGNIIKNSLFSNVTQYNQNILKHIMSHCNIMSGSNLMFKKDVFNKLGGYRVGFIDDYDFVTRALVSGYKIGYQSQSLVYKRDRPNNISNINALKQFVGVYAIGHQLSVNNFSHNVSKKFIISQFKRVTSYDLYKFKLVKVNLYKFKKMLNIKSLIKCLLLILSSKLIFKFYLWSKIYGTTIGQSILMTII